LPAFKSTFVSINNCLIWWCEEEERSDTKGGTK
jgi:hypothetical protein